MPTFYNFRQNGLDYSFDDIFVPADLFREGNLWTWGSPGNGGPLGTNDTTPIRSTPVTIFSGGTDWRQMSSSFNHTAAIKTNGTLWIWGQNSYGQLGNTQITNILTPVTTFSGGTNWRQVSAGRRHTAAIKTDGTLWLWGSSATGRLGNGVTTGNISTPITTFAGGTNWKEVSAGGYGSLAIKTDGTLWTWGSNLVIGNGLTTGLISTPITTFAGGNNWKQVSSASFFAAAIKTDGTLWVWGSGTNGQLGNAQITNRSTPITTFAGGTNWKQVSCGTQFTSAIKTDGTLWVWGSGTNGQLGNGVTTGNISTPITTFAGGTNWKQVGVGDAHTAAIKTDGTLWTCGTNTSGRLGNASTVNVSTPVTTFTGGTNWKQVNAGAFHAVALTYIDSVI